MNSSSKSISTQCVWNVYEIDNIRHDSRKSSLCHKQFMNEKSLSLVQFATGGTNKYSNPKGSCQE